MTKKDYESIALAFQDTEPDNEEDRGAHMIWESIRDRICVTFGTDNPRFIADRFKNACIKGANVKART